MSETSAGKPNSATLQIVLPNAYTPGALATIPLPGTVIVPAALSPQQFAVAIGFANGQGGPDTICAAGGSLANSPPQLSICQLFWGSPPDSFNNLLYLQVVGTPPRDAFMSLNIYDGSHNIVRYFTAPASGNGYGSADPGFVFWEWVVQNSPFAPGQPITVFFD